MYHLMEAVRNEAIYQFTCDQGFNDYPAVYGSGRNYSVLSGLLEAAL